MFNFDLVFELMAFLAHDVNDVLSAIDHVIDTGVAKPSKITALGSSHGCFLTAYMIGQACCFFCCAHTDVS